ncbi:MAG: response regulator [bacterium]|nr:response regulator [bacterium]
MIALQTAEKESPQTKLNRLSVLIVDDEKYIRDLLSELLGDYTQNAETAEDGEVALQKLALNQFDVVVTDIKMPKVDGFSLLKTIKQIYPDTAVVVMTGFSQEFTIREALAQGAEEYLPKPFRFEEVLMVIERAYWRNRARRTAAPKVPAL